MTVKLIRQVEKLIDLPDTLSAAELDKLSNVLKDSAHVLGVRSALDDEEQRAKIAVLISRAAPEKEEPEPIEITFNGETGEAAV